MGLSAQRACGAAVLLVYTAVSGACSEFQAAVEGAVVASDPPQMQPPPPADEQDETALSPEQQAARKLAGYAQCLHRTRSKVVASEASWRATVAAGGTAVSRRVPPVIQAVDPAPKSCARTDREGATRLPSMPKLEGALATYVDALRQVALHSARLSTYYKTRAYAEDDWALSKTLTPTMDSAFGRFDHAAIALSATFEIRADAVARALLAQVHAREGTSARWHAHATMRAARSWARCITPVAARAPADSPLPPPPVQACDAAVSEFIAAANGLTARRQTQAGEATDVFWLTAFAHSVDQLRVLAERIHADPAPAGPPRRKRPRKRGKAAATKPPRARVAAAFDDVVLDYAPLSG